MIKRNLAKKRFHAKKSGKQIASMFALIISSRYEFVALILQQFRLNF